MNATDVMTALPNSNASGQTPAQAAVSAIALLALIAPAEAARLLCDKLNRLPSQPITPPRRG